MKDLDLIYGYGDNDKLRTGFYRLLQEVFKFDLEDWYQKGFWDYRHVPHSLTDGEIFISSVTVNLMDLVLDGQRTKSIQIGTVMTHPDHRNKGLAAQLMNYVIDKYSKDHKFIFLISNSDAAKFYPKFGFEEHKESCFNLDINPVSGDNLTLKKLDITKPDVLNWIYKKAIDRVPISNVFGSEYGHNLLMFHLWYILNDHIYYLEDEDVIAVFKRDGKILHLYDLIGSSTIRFDNIVRHISDNETEQIRFHFTPDLLDVDAESSPWETEDVFYIKSGSVAINNNFLHPKTAEA